MDQSQIFIDMAVKAWNVQISRTGKLLDSLSDDAILKEVAPGKNRIAYLVGHLVAVNDGMIGLFSKGNRSYTAWDEPFVKNPDRTASSYPSVSALRQAWKSSNEQLTSIFNSMTASDWFGRHSSMTDEDLAKEPSRNKLSVLLNRTSHVAYHLGQMMLIKGNE